VCAMSSSVSVLHKCKCIDHSAATATEKQKMIDAGLFGTGVLMMLDECQYEYKFILVRYFS